MTRAFGRILLTTDLSDLSWTALSPAVELARATEARLTVLNVLCPPDERRPAEDEERHDVARTLVNESIEPFTGKWPIDVVVSTSRDPVGEIIKQAGLLDVDLIVLAVRDSEGRERMVSPSVTEELIRRGAFPVLAFPGRILEERHHESERGTISELWVG